MLRMMDRALQERIIGAVVLVVFAVLVVPIFLDGRASEPAFVTQSVTLPGQNDQERRQQTIVLERDRSEPVPATPKVTAAEETQPEARPEPDTQPAAQESRPITQARAEVAAPQDAEKSTTGMWAVQLGSFSSQENAERLAADLRGQGYAAFLSKLETDSGALHRVASVRKRIAPARKTLPRNLAKVVIQGRWCRTHDYLRRRLTVRGFC